jgi:hypothetical protein
VDAVAAVVVAVVQAARVVAPAATDPAYASQESWRMEDGEWHLPTPASILHFY